VLCVCLHVCMCDCVCVCVNATMKLRFVCCNTECNGTWAVCVYACLYV
jgi:hypothetical protein